MFVPEVGALYYGRVVRLMTFGAFVELAPGKDGLVHISKLADHRIEKVEDACKVGDMMWVKVTEIDEKGRVNLSHKDAMKEIEAKRPPASSSSNPKLNRNQAPAFGLYLKAGAFPCEESSAADFLRISRQVSTFFRPLSVIFRKKGGVLCEKYS